MSVPAALIMSEHELTYLLERLNNNSRPLNEVDGSTIYSGEGAGCGEDSQSSSEASTTTPSTYGVGVIGVERTAEWLESQHREQILAGLSRGQALVAALRAPDVLIKSVATQAGVSAAIGIGYGAAQGLRGLGEGFGGPPTSAPTKQGAIGVGLGSAALIDDFADAMSSSGAFNHGFVKHSAGGMQNPFIDGYAPKTRVYNHPPPTFTNIFGNASARDANVFQSDPHYVCMNDFGRYHRYHQITTTAVFSPKPIGYERALKKEVGQMAAKVAEAKAKLQEERHLIVSYNNRPETPGPFVPRRCVVTDEEDTFDYGENDSPITSFIGERIIVDSASPSTSDNSVHKLSPLNFASTPVAQKVEVSPNVITTKASAVDRLLPLFFAPIAATTTKEVAQAEPVTAQLQSIIMTPPSSNITMTPIIADVVTPPPTFRAETSTIPPTPTSLISSADSDIDSDEEVLLFKGLNNMRQSA